MMTLTRNNEPAWLHEQREQGLAAFEKTPYPTSHDEAWRRTDPERVRTGDKPVLTPAHTFGLTACAGPLDSSVTFKPLAEAGDAAQSMLGQLAQPKDSHTALNAAFWAGGTYLHVPKDVSTGAGYLESKYTYTGAGTALTRTVIKVERNSKATYVEHFLADDSEVVAAPVIEIDVAENSKLVYVLVNEWGTSTSVVPRVHARVGKDAHLQMLFVGFGSALTKSHIECDLVGEGCKSEVLGLVLGKGRQHFDIDCQQNHRVGNTVSDVLFHVALTGRSRSVFAGNILCEPGAQKIDGYQQNRNLILSDKARADSMPRLEIEANDVRCTHGASFTTYDPGQRFYLQSRGLNKEEAERLLVTGFFAAVVERLEHPPLVEWLLGQLEGQLEIALAK